MVVAARSPWMPTPYSTSSTPSSKAGPPVPGAVWARVATAIERALAATAAPRAASCSNEAPASAAAPRIFSTATVAAVPRRPVSVPSAPVARSSSTSTVATSTPCARSRSAAMAKLMTSPV